MPRGIKTTPKGYARSSAEEAELRVAKTADWLLENPNARWIDCVNWVMKEFDLLQRQAATYRKRALEKLNGEIQEDYTSSKNLIISALKREWRDAKEREDHDLAFKIQQEINKVSGVYVTRVEQKDVTEQPIFNVSPVKASNKDVNKVIRKDK